MEDDDGFGDLTDEALLSLEVPAPAPAVASPRPVTAVRAQGLGMCTPPRMQHGGLSRARARARPQLAAAQDERLQELRGQVRNKEHALELVRQPEGKTQRGEQGGGRVHTRRRLTEWLTGPRPVATQACGRGVGAAGSRARRGGAASAGRQAHAGPVQGVWWLCACVCVRARVRSRLSRVARSTKSSWRRSLSHLVRARPRTPRSPPLPQLPLLLPWQQHGRVEEGPGPWPRTGRAGSRRRVRLVRRWGGRPPPLCRRSSLLLPVLALALVLVLVGEGEAAGGGPARPRARG
jgi:hypothetical protein